MIRATAEGICRSFVEVFIELLSCFGNEQGVWGG